MYCTVPYCTAVYARMFGKNSMQFCSGRSQSVSFVNFTASQIYTVATATTAVQLYVRDLDRAERSSRNGAPRGDVAWLRSVRPLLRPAIARKARSNNAGRALLKA